MIDAIINISEITKGMKSLGPKALLKINNLSIIEYQINQIKKISRKIRINLITGFYHDKIVDKLKKHKNINYIYNEEYDHTNHGKGIELLLDNNDVSNILYIGSGILLKPKTLSIRSLKNQSSIFVLDRKKSNFDIGCNNSQNLEYMFYDLPLVWSECCYLNKEVCDAIKSLIINKNISQFFMFEIINIILNKNINIDIKKINRKNICKINSQKDIPKIRYFV